MLRGCLSILLLIALIRCSDKKENHAGNDIKNADDFIALFKTLPSAQRFSDTGLAATGDTLTISREIFTRFIPDSVLEHVFEKPSEEMTIHRVGKIENKKGVYLLIKFTQQKKSKLAVFLFDDKNKYLASLKLLNNYSNDKYMHSVSVTDEPTFIISREKKGDNNNMLYTRNGYAFDFGLSNFITVMNDTNEDLKRLSEIINPIDTLPKKNKYSADYTRDKKNFISVRDGKNESAYIFFIHFEKNKGDCTGELKGSMTMTGTSKSMYKENGDPCSINFTFTKSSVTIKEDNCGNHRGLNCLFDDTYKKKKPAMKSEKK
ncbi:MAG: hypothetical protein ABJA79_05220 [Parafilimonas sp.]